jgi:RimJ/RimL family protein N-acetyltransferase
MGWQLHPSAWGHGYATEAGRAIARWAFSQGIDEVLAVVRPPNRRAEATVRRIGMEWVGETEKYFGLRLQVYRLRRADVVPASPAPSRPGVIDWPSA